MRPGGSTCFTNQIIKSNLAQPRRGPLERGNYESDNPGFRDRRTWYPRTRNYRARDLFAFRRHEVATTGESPRAEQEGFSRRYPRRRSRGPEAGEVARPDSRSVEFPRLRFSGLNECGPSVQRLMSLSRKARTPPHASLRLLTERSHRTMRPSYRQVRGPANRVSETLLRVGSLKTARLTRSQTPRSE